jgi:hypothetical protein
MKFTTIALAVALTVPSSFALARGGMLIGSHVTRAFANPVGTGRVAQTQECYGKYARSHRARSKRIDPNWVSYEPHRRLA